MEIPKRQETKAPQKNLFFLNCKHSCRVSRLKGMLTQMRFEFVSVGAIQFKNESESFEKKTINV